jgi:hypothetical protein
MRQCGMIRLRLRLGDLALRLRRGTLTASSLRAEAAVCQWHLP